MLHSCISAESASVQMTASRTSLPLFAFASFHGFVENVPRLGILGFRPRTRVEDYKRNSWNLGSLSLSLIKLWIHPFLKVAGFESNDFSSFLSLAFTLAMHPIASRGMFDFADPTDVNGATAGHLSSLLQSSSGSATFPLVLSFPLSRHFAFSFFLPASRR